MTMHVSHIVDGGSIIIDYRLAIHDYSIILIMDILIYYHIRKQKCSQCNRFIDKVSNSDFWCLAKFGYTYTLNSFMALRMVPKIPNKATHISYCSAYKD